MLTSIAHLFAGVYNCLYCNRGGDAKLVMIKSLKMPNVVSTLPFAVYRSGGFCMNESTMISF